MVKGETMLHHSVSSVAHAWAYLFAHPESIMKFFQIVQTGIAIYQASGGHVSKQVIKDITLAAVVANAMGVEPVSATP